jgi:hypothetical protein
MTAKCSCIISSKIKKHWSWGIEYLHRNEKKMKNTYLSQSYESFRMLFFTKYTFIFFLRFISNKKKHFFFCTIDEAHQIERKNKTKNNKLFEQLLYRGKKYLQKVRMDFLCE